MNNISWLGGFYNNSDIDITLVSYVSGYGTVKQEVAKGSAFIPVTDSSISVIPVGIQQHTADPTAQIAGFPANHIEVCSKSNPTDIWSFCANEVWVPTFFYCSGNEPSSLSSFSVMQMPAPKFISKFYIVFSGSNGQYQFTANTVPPTPNSYDFDVVIKSDATPSVVNQQTKTSDTNNPIAAAFGYSFIPLSDFTSTSSQPLVIGERTSQPIAFQSRVRFGIYDLATQKVANKAISEVTVSFTSEKDNANGPFGWQGGQMTFSKDQVFAKDSVNSYGCNIECAAGYYLGDPNPSGFQVINAGSYELAVTVTLEDGTVFQADPEVDIEGAT